MAYPSPAKAETKDEWWGYAKGGSLAGAATNMLVSHVIFVHTLHDRPPFGRGNIAVSSENGTLKVGARLRRARLSKGLRMRDLAQAVGCDESMISKIEAGKVMPSLPMLNKMVEALDRDMASFFGLRIDEYKLVQKPEERMKVPVDALRGGAGVTYERLVPVAAGNLLEANVHVVAPGGEKVDLITHQGEAVGYLVSGTIELTIDDTTYMMTSGDSFFFKAYLTNSYRNLGPDEARIIWVNTPQVH